MNKRANRIAAVVTAASIATACLGSQAAGTPAAASAKAANTMIANAMLAEPPAPDSNKAYVEISGQITSPSHKLGPRRCRANRTIRITNTRLDGTVAEGDTYPTTKIGRFGVEIALDYGGDVPDSGGSVAFSLSTPKTTVGKDKLGFRSFTCRALSLTVRADIPPHPTFG